ncbi:MAG: DUF3857 domain-containing protein [Candidatus Omnitrophota bacterium]
MDNFRKIIFIVFAWACLAGCSKVDLDVLRADRLSREAQKYSREAIRLYQDVLALRLNAKKADSIRLKLGKLYFQTGDHAAAVDVLRKIDSKESRPLLAQALFKDSDFTGALEAFNKAGEQGSPKYLYYYGLTLEKNNLYDKALHIFSGIRMDPVFGARAKARIVAINLDSSHGFFSGVEDEVKNIILDSADAGKYPEASDASGLFLLAEDDITLTQDFREVIESHYVIKVLNDRGKEKFAEIVLQYDSTYEKLDLEYARTIKPDGSVVTVGDKNIRDVSLYLNFPLYSNARARIISMPEVTDGSVIEYKVRLSRSQLPNKKDFDTTYWLQNDEPILLQRCSIRVPKNIALKYKIINGDYNTFGFDMKPKIREVGDTTVYSLEFKDVPQIIPEPMMPSLAKVNPYVLFSTFDSWQDIYEWWRGLYKDKAIADESIKAKVAELTKDKKTQDEKLRAIYNFCAADIRYVAVEYGDAGYEPHKAGEIFKNKYGDCKDKAILLITMLKEAGIDAFPVLISTQDSFETQEDVPSLLFNHAIAATIVGGKLIFMDVTGNTVSFSDLPLSDQDRTTLVFFQNKFELVRTPLFASEHNRMLTEMKIKVKADESIDAERRAEAQGSFLQAQRYWLKFTMPALIEEGLKQKIRGIADSAILKGYEIKNVEDLDKPVVLRYTFSAPQYFKRAGSSRILGQLAAIDTSVLLKDTRLYPIESAGLSKQEERIEVELPGSLAVKYVPPPVRLDTKWFYFNCNYDIVNKSTLRFSYEYKIKERVVSVSEYAEYKKAIEEIVPLVNQQVVLERR